MTLKNTLILTLILMSLIVVFSAESTTSTGTLSGSIVDIEGHPLPGATVVARHLKSGIERSEMTNAKGRYFISGLSSGAFEVTASLDGFNSSVQRVRIAAGQDVQLKLVLKLSSVEELIVTEEAPVVELSSEKDREGARAKSTRHPPSRALESAPMARQNRRIQAPKPGTTGGYAEPNDAPYGDMYFKPYGVNPFIDTDEDPLSTFGLDVDTSSYTMARSYLNDGNLPPAEAIRVEEFVNYFGGEDKRPVQGDFRLEVDGLASPWRSNADYRLVRFSLTARTPKAHRRPPAHLTFVIDVSGSMDSGGRLEMVKEGLVRLVDELRDDDQVAIVTYSNSARVLQRPTRHHRQVKRIIASLRTEGSTNAEAGLRLGYRLADEQFDSRAINRVILCSDGVANVGNTGANSILRTLEREGRRGIELTAIGVGMGNYNDVLLEQLADHGDGQYHYVDNLDEVERVFVENLTGLLQTIAHDARVQVEFNPNKVTRYRLLGYENRAMADRDFRNDSVDAGEVGAGHRVTAFYEIKLAKGVRGEQNLGEFKLRYRRPKESSFREAHRTFQARDTASNWRHASRDLRVLAVAAEFAERLRHSFWIDEVPTGATLRRARSLGNRERLDPEIRELVSLVETWGSLVRHEPDRRRRSHDFDEEGDLATMEGFDR